MRKFYIIVVILILITSFSGNIMAREGFSAGMTLGFGTDVGELTEKSLDDAGQNERSTSTGGVYGLQLGVFGQYVFLHALFVRTGFEYTFGVSEGESTDKSTDIKTTYKASNWVIPFFIGINAPLSHGVNIYIAGGPMWMHAEYEINTETASTGTTISDTTVVSSDTVKLGYVLLMGGDVEVVPQVNVIVETERYIWADLGKAKTKASGITIKSSSPMSMSYWTYRLGVKYSF